MWSFVLTNAAGNRPTQPQSRSRGDSSSPSQQRSERFFSGRTSTLIATSSQPFEAVVSPASDKKRACWMRSDLNVGLELSALVPFHALSLPIAEADRLSGSAAVIGFERCDQPLERTGGVD